MVYFLVFSDATSYTNTIREMLKNVKKAGWNDLMMLESHALISVCYFIVVDMLLYIGRCTTLYRTVCYFIEVGMLRYIERCAALYRTVCYFI